MNRGGCQRVEGRGFDQPAALTRPGSILAISADDRSVADPDWDRLGSGRFGFGDGVGNRKSRGNLNDYRNDNGREGDAHGEVSEDCLPKVAMTRTLWHARNRGRDMRSWKVPAIIDLEPCADLLVWGRSRRDTDLDQLAGPRVQNHHHVVSHSAHPAAKRTT